VLHRSSYKLDVVRPAAASAQIAPAAGHD